jgi:hypothetical protein
VPKKAEKKPFGFPTFDDDDLVLTEAKRVEMDLDALLDDLTSGNAPGMCRLSAFVERLERLVLYDAPMTADDAREITALGIGEIDVKRQRFRLSPQFAAVVRRKTAN